MSQHDYVIDNGSGSTVRSDLNSALGAIQTLNSGATAPGTIVANMLWFDTTTGFLKKRNNANTAWQVVDPVHVFAFALSDEVTALTTGTGKVSYRMPYACTALDLRGCATVAPTGANLVIDMNVNGSTVLSTKLTIPAGTTTSVGATQPVFSSTSIASDDIVTFDIDTVGSTIEGKGAKATLYVVRV